jgi:hypothetical protein
MKYSSFLPFPLQKILTAHLGLEMLYELKSIYQQEKRRI